MTLGPKLLILGRQYAIKNIIEFYKNTNQSNI